MKVVGSDKLASISFDRIVITDIAEPLEAYNDIRACGIPREKIVMI